MKSEMHMSNLNLPTMSYANLHKLLEDAGKSRLRIAYATEIVQGPLYIEVQHHGSTIARVWPAAVGRVQVDTCGWDSMTTSQRISKVLGDNDVPFAVSIRKGKTTLLARPTLAPVARLTTATFQNGELV
ncbi:hypothetical protein SEA_CECE_331 [Microbacterium phage Cece]|nr:hypothetical protein SEA_CECE_29 [Microbacterium phage Cece]UVG35337.1 hypothetical protein SEA_CECE_331 [Microbacterium phage Cece]